MFLGLTVEKLAAIDDIMSFCSVLHPLSAGYLINSSITLYPIIGWSRRSVATEAAVKPLVHFVSSVVETLLLQNLFMG